jgi:hypothetical protein
MALQTQQFSVGTTAVQVLGQSSKPQQVILHNASKSSNTFIWFGGNSSVTTTTGAHLDDAETYQLVLQPGNELWAISDSGDRPLHVLWQVL